ncbi:ATP-binding cassette domain-containing protein [Pantoea alhagi]|uniref:ATP-binding cassette domain-containing protein n=1 Tax=Pantoea alhagi TaxID=1891675 RepID=UPI00202AD4C3|nr:ATP-binding cassette domain-containing protein [Pantoea alhagi]URQ59183.1 ATP-binding cassette domain-containing protein [Pantoea alhagi]
MIKLSHLSKSYAGAAVPALADISLTIEEGSIFGILGRSGAGKSTLLRCLNRLERPSSGMIEIDGRDISQLSLAQLRRQRQQMGMIFQHFNLLHSRNVHDNIDLPLEIAGVAVKERRQRVESGSIAQIMSRREGRLRQMLLKDGETDRAFIAKYQPEELSRCVA